MTTIAQRRYDLDGYQFTETMTRGVDGAFVCKLDAGGHPSEGDQRTGYTLAEVFEWLRDMPHQIERAIY